MSSSQYLFILDVPFKKQMGKPTHFGNQLNNKGAKPRYVTAQGAAQRNPVIKAPKTTQALKGRCVFNLNKNVSPLQGAPVNV
jgi:hypothetical protein